MKKRLIRGGLLGVTAIALLIVVGGTATAMEPEVETREVSMAETEAETGEVFAADTQISETTESSSAYTPPHGDIPLSLLTTAGVSRAMTAILTTAEAELESTQLELVGSSYEAVEATSQESELVADESAEAIELAEAVEEAAELEPVEDDPLADAVNLGEFRVTYYCAEPYKHICGYGTGETASGRPLIPYFSAAVDRKRIPLGSKLAVDFGDGTGLHYYSADDVGSMVKGKHIDLCVQKHAEALAQTRVKATIYLLPDDFELPRPDAG